MKQFSLALGFGLLLLSPAPAGASDEFEGGFQDELGRIAAHEAVGLGRGILAQILLGAPPPPRAVYAPPAYAPPPPPVYATPYPVYVQPYPVYAYPAPAYWGWAPYGRYYRHGHGHHHGHHHGCDD